MFTRIAVILRCSPAALAISSGVALPTRARTIASISAALFPVAHTMKTKGTLGRRSSYACGGCGEAGLPCRAKKKGAIDLNSKLCEDCGDKQASFGLPTDRKRRWCGPCGKKQGAIGLALPVPSGAFVLLLLFCETGRKES